MDEATGTLRFALAVPRRCATSNYQPCHYAYLMTRQLLHLARKTLTQKIRKVGMIRSVIVL